MLRRKVSRTLVLVLAVLVAATGALPASALLDEKLQERDDLERRLAQERASVAQHRNREVALQHELDQLDRRLRELRAEIGRLAGEIHQTEQEIAVTEAELAEAEARLAAQEELFNRRLRAMHKRGSVTYLEVLLSAISFGDFLTRLNNLQIIASNDLRLVEEIQAERDYIQRQKEELERQKDYLEEMRRQTQAREAEVEHTAAMRKQVLAELQEEIARSIEAIEAMEREAQDLSKLISRMILESGGLPGLSGKMHYPMAPPLNPYTRYAYGISSKFGYRPDPFTGVRKHHGGIDIVPRDGAANHILAAEAGLVELAGWNGAYGNCIMINHGGNVITAYGHMSKLLVSKDQYVAKGQPIGLAGTTGYSTGVHLHFEVWDYNRPPHRSYAPWDRRHDPLEYLF